MKLALVYQAGIAHVFEVICFNLSDYGRGAKRLWQGSFQECEVYCLGAAKAGAVIRSLGCNMAGDISSFKWTDEIESLPWSEEHRPVHRN
jgi:hypothetical protein